MQIRFEYFGAWNRATRFNPLMSFWCDSSRYFKDTLIKLPFIMHCTTNLSHPQATFSCSFFVLREWYSLSNITFLVFVSLPPRPPTLPPPLLPALAVFRLSSFLASRLSDPDPPPFILAISRLDNSASNAGDSAASWGKYKTFVIEFYRWKYGWMKLKEKPYFLKISGMRMGYGNCSNFFGHQGPKGWSNSGNFRKAFGYSFLKRRIIQRTEHK